ncbi:hypothetical protein Hanom_Chr12g01181641 [Helianthus anomalus]
MFFEVEACQDGFTQSNGPKILNNAMFVRSKRIFFRKVKDKDVMKRFQAMKKKRTNLLGFCFTLFIYCRFF